MNLAIQFLHVDVHVSGRNALPRSFFMQPMADLTKNLSRQRTFQHTDLTDIMKVIFYPSFPSIKCLYGASTR